MLGMGGSAGCWAAGRAHGAIGDAHLVLGARLYHRLTCPRCRSAAAPQVCRWICDGRRARSSYASHICRLHGSSGG
eukprot:1933566-Prymnesium_polylepis.1